MSVDRGLFPGRGPEIFYQYRNSFEIQLIDSLKIVNSKLSYHKDQCLKVGLPSGVDLFIY